MTREELYDMAVERWGENTAVVKWGDRYIVGRWVRLNVNLGDLILHSEKYGRGIEVMGEGDSWEEAAKALSQPSQDAPGTRLVNGSPPNPTKPPDPL